MNASRENEPAGGYSADTSVMRAEANASSESPNLHRGGALQTWVFSVLVIAIVGLWIVSYLPVRSDRQLRSLPTIATNGGSPIAAMTRETFKSAVGRGNTRGGCLAWMSGDDAIWAVLVREGRISILRAKTWKLTSPPGVIQPRHARADSRAGSSHQDYPGPCGSVAIRQHDTGTHRVYVHERQVFVCNGVPRAVLVLARRYIDHSRDPRRKADRSAAPPVRRPALRGLWLQPDRQHQWRLPGMRCAHLMNATVGLSLW